MSNDFECDVLVIGSGAAGLATAITARKRGLDVVVIEKEPVFGGTTALSGGVLWIPMNHHGREQNPADTREAVRNYMVQQTGPHAQPLVGTASTPSTLYAARLVSDGSTIATRVNLVNPTSSNATVTLRAFSKAGAALAAPVIVTLAAGQQYQRDIAAVFGFTPGVLTQGSVVVESNITGLTGDVIYSDPTGAKLFRAALALDGAIAKSATFARVDNTAGHFTEVYISNPNSQVAAVDMAVFRADGSQAGVKSIQIPAGGAVADQLSNLVPASIGQSGGYFVVSANQRVSAGATFGTLNKTMLAAIPAERLPDVKKAPSDFDGDGKSDVSVYRENEGNWYILKSATNTVAGIHFGNVGDRIVPGDYDGDGKADCAVFRPSDGTWYLFLSTGAFTGIKFGASDDIPAQGDFDGDGKTDLAVFRPSTGVWFIQSSSTGAVTATQFGQTGDRPVAADYDADGKTDVAVFRPSEGNWYLLRSTAGFTGIHFGTPTDKVVPADYDGDGKTDPAVYRDGTWFLFLSTGTFTGISFGTPTDIPAPGDFDGDGKTDLSVFRPSTGVWFQQRSTSGFFATQFGQNGDKPVPAGYVPIQ